MARYVINNTSALNNFQKNNASKFAPQKRTALAVINGKDNFLKPRDTKISANSQKNSHSNFSNKAGGFSKFKDIENNKEKSSSDEKERFVLSESGCNTSKFKTLNYCALKNNECSEKSDGSCSSAKDFSSVCRKEAFENSVWNSPYLNDIYCYLKGVEQKFRPKPTYMLKQPDITLSMRSVLVDWLAEVGEEYKLQVETFHLAVSYIDRFLSRMSVVRGKLQLVGTASMFIAAKYEEIYPPELKDFVYITDDTYTKKQILRMEHLILKVLEFDVAAPTAYSFLQIFCCMSSVKETALYLAQYICELSLLEADPFLQFAPSEIAAASLALANYSLGYDIWTEDLVKSSGYTLDHLKRPIECLYDRYSKISKFPQQAICEKYKSDRFCCVANIQHPESLTL